MNQTQILWFFAFNIFYLCHIYTDIHNMDYYACNNGRYAAICSIQTLSRIINEDLMIQKHINTKNTNTRRRGQCRVHHEFDKTQKSSLTILNMVIKFSHMYVDVNSVF